MREPRNPFRMRTAEHIESDATFLRLFGPGVLDLLPKYDLWDRVRIFRSAPGGGKTSLFRAFTPLALLTLYELRVNEDFKELYQRMKTLDAISEQGPQVLGIMLSCARNYAIIQDINIEPARKDRLLYALFNARIIIGALRGALVLKKLRYPEDLSKITIAAPLESYEPIINFPTPSTGKDLYEWACHVERSVSRIMDSFGPVSDEFIEGNETLEALNYIKPELITYNGEAVAQRTLIMFDDFHKLTGLQRQKLLSTLFDLKAPLGIWIAERFEALETEELLGLGVTTGREYEEPINLEQFWGASRKFENVVTSIADKRAKSAVDIQAGVGSFAECLDDAIDSETWRKAHTDAAITIAERIRRKTRAIQRYSSWIEQVQENQETPRQQAIAWRILEIRIERDMRKTQLAFDFDLTLEEFNNREASAVKTAAEFLNSREFNIPYYYGISRISLLASSNIEQFLAFSGSLFEEIVSAALLRRQPRLAPNRQEAILKEVANQRWEEIPRRIPFGRDVQNLLQAVSLYAQKETNRPNVPYPPGVTGIAISMVDRQKLLSNRLYSKDARSERIAQVLSACIAYNLLEVTLDAVQGQKGKTWMVLYLNRWLCVKFDLPLNYGGWRSKSLLEIEKWLDNDLAVINHEQFQLLNHE